MTTPHVPRAPASAKRLGVHFDNMDTSYFVGREILVPSMHQPLSGWRERTNRVVELGTQAPI
ncbi:MAG TPA: hypothetical protein VHJ00_12025 [Bradyrhizobium sp.]|jgi:KUP system potassium uptake protein|nr:hypothetical protein [Bradyrhizobium sp.]